MIRVIIKGKQGVGKTALAEKITTMLRAEGISFSVQDGGETSVHKHVPSAYAPPRPVSVAIIVKQG